MTTGFRNDVAMSFSSLEVSEQRLIHMPNILQRSCGVARMGFCSEHIFNLLKLPSDLK